MGVTEPAGTEFAKNLIAGHPERSKLSLGKLAVEFVQGKITEEELTRVLEIIAEKTGYRAALGPASQPSVKEDK